MIDRTRNNEKLYIQTLDIICIVISFFLASWSRFGNIIGIFNENAYTFALLLLVLGYMVISNIVNGDLDFFKRGFFKEFTIVFRLNLILILLISTIFFYLKTGAIYSRVFFVIFFFFNIMVDYIVRQYLKVVLLAYYKKSDSSKKVMIITTSDQVESIIDHIKKELEWKLLVTSIAIVDKDMTGQEISGIRVIANADNLFDVTTKSVVDEVFLNVPYGKYLNLNNLILEFENMGITVNLSIAAFNMNIQEKTVKNFYGYNVLTFSTRLFNISSMALKRAIDIIGALAGLFITFIVSLFIAPAIFIESPGPLVFSQVRIGKNGRRFKIYKFRSMYKDAEARKKELMKKNEMEGLMFKIEHDPRITKVGKFIRKTSIDELPQFWNVLKGDMSLVGTRPPTEDEFLQYEGWHKRRLSLRPGITGLWQVSGRSEIKSFEEVVKMDLDYIDNWSLLLDVKLLLKTVVVVLFRVGAK